MALPHAVSTLPLAGVGRAAPARSAPVRRSVLLGGDAGVFQTLTAMRTVIRRAVADPRIQLAARTAAPLGSTPLQIRDGILSWLLTHSVFRNDPVAVELVRTPTAQLGVIARQGRMPGDCDDAATLGAALALTRGLPTRLTVIGFGPTGPATSYTHVYPEVRVGGGWLDLDVQRRADSPMPTRLASLEV